MSRERTSKPEPAHAPIGQAATDGGPPTWQRRDPVAIDPIQYKAWCDERLASMMAEPIGVQQAAATGVSGPASALPHGDAIQASFGHHDVSGVRAHVGGAAADASEQMGAKAYATGDRVAFASQPDLHLAAHEAAHVVQQRGGVQLKGGVGQVGDAYEQQADAVADAVVRGESAEQLLGSAPAVDQGPAARTTVQRFSAREHQQMGNDGAGSAWVELAEGYSIPFGDMVALAGDHFSSIEQMRELAKNENGGAGSRLEIEWARKWMLRANVTWVDSDPKYQKARAAQESRYYKLAAGNAPNYKGNNSHFLNPRDGDSERSTADKAVDVETRPDDRTDGSKGSEWTPALGGVGSIASYRLNHVKAIIAAAEAGAHKKPIDAALAADGFACHYLTDSFAGGHVRTERLSIKQHWDGKVPMFPTNLAGYMSQEIARYLRSHESDVDIELEAPLFDTPLPSVHVYPDADNFAESTVTGKALEKVNKSFQQQAFISFGDVISGALHDRDNANGVTAHVHGKREVLRGDSHAYDAVAKGQPANNTAELARQAVALSVADIYRAKELGKTMSAPEVIAQLFDAEARLFPAEEFIPTLTKEDLADSRNEEIEWKVGSVGDLLKNPAMSAAIADFIKSKGSEIKELKVSFPGAEGDALDALAGNMATDPAGVLFQVVNWTPGDASTPPDQQRRAKEYISASKKVPGGFASLTDAQRLSLILDIIAINPDNENRRRVWELIDGMDPRGASHVFPAIGWERLRGFLGGKGYLADKLAAKFPKDRFGQ